jgi:hypothetical protein
VKSAVVTAVDPAPGEHERERGSGAGPSPCPRPPPSPGRLPSPQPRPSARDPRVHVPPGLTARDGGNPDVISPGAGPCRVSRAKCRQLDKDLPTVGAPSDLPSMSAGNSARILLRLTALRVLVSLRRSGPAPKPRAPGPTRSRPREPRAAPPPPPPAAHRGGQPVACGDFRCAPVAQPHRHVPPESRISDPPDRRPPRPHVPLLPRHAHEIDERRRLHARYGSRSRRILLRPAARSRSRSRSRSRPGPIILLATDLDQLRRVPRTHLLGVLPVHRFLGSAEHRPRPKTFSGE